MGAVWVYVLRAGIYTFEASIVPADAATGDQIGLSVALSADGNTLGFGGPLRNLTGAAWVYARVAGVWTLQAELTGSPATTEDSQGSHVALSADGNTFAVGSPGTNSGLGQTFVFVRSGGTWTQQGSALVGTDIVGVAYQGSIVSLDVYGNTLAIGGDGSDDSNIGAAWIFVRINGVSGPVWAQQGPKLVGTGVIGGISSQGASLALSKNGNTLLSGGVDDNSSAGAVWVFARYDGVWTQLMKLTSSDAFVTTGFGGALALDADGTTAAIGGSGNSPYQGAVLAYV